jgi:phosphatidate cytidylyltransferase
MIAGLLGAFILIMAIWWNEWSYFIVFLGICGFTLWEFYTLVEIDGKYPMKFYGTFCGLFIFTINFLIEQKIIDYKYYLLFVPVLTVIFLLVLYKKKETKPFTAAAFTLFGIFYVALPFAMLNVLAFSRGEYRYELVLGTFLMLWASDTGAYFFGSRFGKRRLFQRVSPKKSWEGSVGGALLTLFIGYCCYIWFGELPLWQWECLAAIIIVAGTYGDLIESLFKRSIDIKDSGTVIPGHGGFLDRFDGLLFAAPYVATFLKIF